MKIFVAGSEGSLMQWTIKHLLKENHEVIGADNRSRYSEEVYDKMKMSGKYDYVRGDLTNFDFVKKNIENADAVIQGAAMIYGVKGFHENPAQILSNDLLLHRNICEASRNNNISRLVYISSSMVYERGEVPHRESEVFDLPIPSTDYGLSKVVGERMCRAYKKQYDVNYTIWRPFNIITPYEKAEEEPGMSHVFADFIKKIIVEKQNPMKIFGSGEQVRCFTWIDEIAKAIATESFKEITINEAYNLANPEPVSMKELARRIFEKGKEKGLIEGESLDFDHKDVYEDDVKKRIPSIEKAKRDFDWDPKVKLDDALDVCLDNLKDLYDV